MERPRFGDIIPSCVILFQMKFAEIKLDAEALVEKKILFLDRSHQRPKRGRRRQQAPSGPMLESRQLRRNMDCSKYIEQIKMTSNSIDINCS